MSYVLAETINDTGNNQLHVAPATWTVQHKGKVYLRWPKVREISELNAMLADKSILPKADWERRACQILYRNVPLALAKDLLAKTQQRSKTNSTEWKPAEDVPVAEKNKVENDTPSGSQAWCNVLGNLQNEIMPDIPTPEEDPLGVLHSSAGQFEAIHVRNESPNSNLEYDPLGDIKPFSQLVDLIKELKCIIQSNQEEILKRLDEDFYRMQKTMFALVANRAPGDLITEKPPGTVRVDISAPSDAEVERNPLGTTETFVVKLCTCKADIDAFEARLNDEVYRQKVHSWISGIVHPVTNPRTCMMDILDLLMDRKFFTQFSWTNERRPQTIPLAKYVNFCELFQYAGTTPDHQADLKYVETFFKLKIKHSRSRINIIGCVAKRRRIYQKSRMNDNAREDRSKKRKLPDRIQMQEKRDMTEVKPVTEQTNQASVEIVEVNVNPITCVEGMFEFNAELGNLEYLQEVHKWADNTVGSISDPEQRMEEILAKLVDGSFLQNFSRTKQTIVSYGNFVRLFEYVASTAHHKANHKYVVKFFQEKLHYLASTTVSDR